MQISAVETHSSQNKWKLEKHKIHIIWSEKTRRSIHNSTREGPVGTLMSNAEESIQPSFQSLTWETLSWQEQEEEYLSEKEFLKYQVHRESNSTQQKVLEFPFFWKIVQIMQAGNLIFIKPLHCTCKITIAWKKYSIQPQYTASVQSN